jgi:hypothetical protein
VIVDGVEQKARYFAIDLPVANDPVVFDRNGWIGNWIPPLEVACALLMSQNDLVAGSPSQTFQLVLFWPLRLTCENAGTVANATMTPELCTTFWILREFTAELDTRDSPAWFPKIVPQARNPRPWLLCRSPSETQ